MSDFGKGVINNIGWGSIYKKTPTGETEITTNNQKDKEDDNKD